MQNTPIIATATATCLLFPDAITTARPITGKLMMTAAEADALHAELHAEDRRRAEILPFARANAFRESRLIGTTLPATKSRIAGSAAAHHLHTGAVQEHAQEASAATR